MRSPIIPLFLAIFSPSTATTPLTFHQVKSGPHQYKIYIDPLIGVGRINELAYRKIRLSYDNATDEIVENYDVWETLVKDADNDHGYTGAVYSGVFGKSKRILGEQRYVFVKGRLCDEVDWRLVYTDVEGKINGPFVQRMLPSAQHVLWYYSNHKVGQSKAGDRADVESVVYRKELDEIVVRPKFNAVRRALIGQKTLSAANLTNGVLVELVGCRFAFRRAEQSPLVRHDGSVVFGGAYGRHGCTFRLRQSHFVYDFGKQCREQTTTSDESSARLELWCGRISAMNCTEESSSTQDCQMDCSPFVDAKLLNRQRQGTQEEKLIVSYQASVTNRPIAGHIIRHAEVDHVHMNYPVKEYSAELERRSVSEKRELELKAFSDDPGASYALQICSLFVKSNCDLAAVQPNWDKAEKKLIFFNLLPSSRKTIPSATTTTTTTPAGNNAAENGTFSTTTTTSSAAATSSTTTTTATTTSSSATGATSVTEQFLIPSSDGHQYVTVRLLSAALVLLLVSSVRL